MDTGSARLTITGLADEHGLALDGDVDSHTADQLSARIDALEANDDVVLDLGAVNFMDSSGLRVLIAAHHARQDAGHHLVLRTPSPAVDRLLEVSGLQGHLDIA